MAHSRLFKGFLSYAHYDLNANPELVKAFIEPLERRVTAKLVNARFDIFRDVEGLRTGDLYDKKLEAELRSSDVLIVFISPKWIESDYCRREYLIFEQVEASRKVGQYVAPILLRAISSQEKHLTDDQKDIASRIMSRQYIEADAALFNTVRTEQRKTLIDKLADDIVGMIERLRDIELNSKLSIDAPLRQNDVREFSVAAHNFEKVDFISGAEVMLARGTGNGGHEVYAQVDFIERLYVQGKNGRIDFGVRRALLRLKAAHGEAPLQTPNLRNRTGGRNTYYISRRDAADAVTICIDPSDGHSTLNELALPPSPGQNYLAQIAMLPTNSSASSLQAELFVSLSSEGLFLVDKRTDSPTNRVQNMIKAILKVAITKDHWASDKGELRRSLPIRRP